MKLIFPDVQVSSLVRVHEEDTSWLEFTYEDRSDKTQVIRVSLNDEQYEQVKDLLNPENLPIRDEDQTSNGRAPRD